jgi:hypothetical protein
LPPIEVRTYRRIYADDRRSESAALPLMNIENTDLSENAHAHFFPGFFQCHESGTSSAGLSSRQVK